LARGARAARRRVRASATSEKQARAAAHEHRTVPS